MSRPLTLKVQVSWKRGWKNYNFYNYKEPTVAAMTGGATAHINSKVAVTA